MNWTEIVLGLFTLLSPCSGKWGSSGTRWQSCAMRLDSGGGIRTHHRGETLWAEVAIVAAFAFLFRPNSRTKIGQTPERKSAKWGNKIWPNNQMIFRHVSHQKSANCHIKNRPTATFETLAVRDLRVYAESLDGKVYHYRDKNGLECDAVVHLQLFLAENMTELPVLAKNN